MIGSQNVQDPVSAIFAHDQIMGFQIITNRFLTGWQRQIVCAFFVRASFDKSLDENERTGVLGTFARNALQFFLNKSRALLKFEFRSAIQ